MDLSYEQYAPTIINRYGLKKSGKEYRGACPSCGGKDRFWIFRKEDTGLGVQCRQCSDFKAIFDRMRDDGVLPKWQPDTTNYLHEEQFLTGTYIDKKGFSLPLAGGAYLDGKTLCVPMFDLVTGANLGVQRIEPDGHKRFAKGSEISSAVHEIGIPSDTAYAVEGWATGYALHRATGNLVYVCFSADGLRRNAARIEHPNVIVAADNDTAGIAAAEASGRPWVAPQADGQDWWDVWNQGGSEAVQKQLCATIGQSRGDFFVASDWADKPVPERQWLVDQWIPERQVTSLYGDGGVGKSLLALQAAMCVASGSSWLGLATKAGPALFVTAEDDTSELHIRAAAVASEMGLELGALSDLHIRSLAGEDAVLGTFDRSGKLAASPLFARVKEYVAQTKPVLVVFDTLADLFAGNENDRTQARQFVGLLRGLAIKDECAVLLLAHPSLSGMASGSGAGGNTAWNNSVRSRLYLDRVKDDSYEPNPDQRTLRQMKANYAKAFGEIKLTYVRGAFVADNPGTFLDRKAHLAKAERVFFIAVVLV
jgi:hypothetical protein